MDVTFSLMASRLGVPYCSGGCGLNDETHENGSFFLGVLHWRERRFTRRGAKNFLMLIAQHDRLNNPEYLNAPKFEWMYLYEDSTAAQSLAAACGFRIPGRLFDRERWHCKWMAHRDGVKLSTYPAIYQWANNES